MDEKVKKLFLILAITIFIFASIIYFSREFIIYSDYIGYITDKLTPSDDKTIPVLKKVESFYTNVSFILAVILIVPFVLWIKRLISHLKNQNIVQFIYLLTMAVSFELFVFSISTPKLFYYNTIKDIKVSKGYIEEIIYKKVYKPKTDDFINLPSEIKLKITDNSKENILVAVKRPYLFEGKDSEGKIKKNQKLNFYIGKDYFDNIVLFKIEEDK